MRIYLCGGKICVPKHLLNCPQVCAIFQKMRGKTVPDSMRGIAFLQSNQPDEPLQNYIELPIVKRLARVGQKQMVVFTFRVKLRSDGKIGLDGLYCGSAHRHDALLIAFAFHSEQAFFDVQIAQQDTANLADTQAGRIYQLKDGTVADAGFGVCFRYFQEQIDFFFREKLGQGLFKLGSVHAFHRTFFKDALLFEKAEKHTQSCHFAGKRAVFIAFVMQHTQEISDHESVDVFDFHISIGEKRQQESLELFQIKPVAILRIDGFAFYLYVLDEFIYVKLH